MSSRIARALLAGTANELISAVITLRVMNFEAWRHIEYLVSSKVITRSVMTTLNWSWTLVFVE